MRAHQIMTRQVITTTVDTPIVQAARTLLLQHISGMPVLDDAGKLVGVVSQGDFMRRAEIGTQRRRPRWLKLLIGPGRAAVDFVRERGRKVGDVMNNQPITVSEDTTLEEVTETLEKNDIKRVPVMRGDKLVGIITRTNLVQAVLDLARDVPDPTADDDHISRPHFRRDREERLEAVRARCHRAGRHRPSEWSHHR
jgi:CBS domain-containing protein